MSPRGWVCSYRAIWDHPIFAGDAERVGVWDWMIKRAAWKPTRIRVNGKIIELDRGQLCVSYRQVCRETGMSQRRFRTFLAALLADSTVTQDTTHGRTVLTICNYGRYQNFDKPADTAATQQRHTKEQVNNKTTSVSKETGADDAPSQLVPFDLRKVVFDTVVPALRRAGHDEKSARSLIGRWFKSGNTDADVLRAYEAAQKSGAVEPFSYMEKILRGAEAPEVGSGTKALAALRARRRDRQ